jgi:hypothetical protein
MIFLIGGDDIYTYIEPNIKANIKLNQLILNVLLSCVVLTIISSIYLSILYFFIMLQGLASFGFL